VGAHLPLDIVGGLGVGWAIGSLVHWAFGVPPRLPGLVVAVCAIPAVLGADALAKAVGRRRHADGTTSVTP
jgi:hypothetical protein